MKRDEIEGKFAAHDPQIEGIRKLILTGMRLILKIEQAQLRNDEQIRELQEQTRVLQQAQMRTDEQLRALIESLRGGGNGHGTAPAL